MPSITDMAEKGKRKYQAKVDQMEKNYSDMKSEAISRFSDVGFGSNMVNAYREGMNNYAVQNYRDSVDRNTADKWARNWQAKVTK